MIFDIGHGMGSLDFETAAAMLEAGLPARRHQQRRAFPLRRRPGLRHPRDGVEVHLPRHAAAGRDRHGDGSAGPALGRDDLGSLRVGAVGDAAVLELMEGRFTYVDAMGETMVGKHRLKSHGIAVGGRWRPASVKLPRAYEEIGWRVS